MVFKTAKTPGAPDPIFSETGSLMVDPIGFAHNSNLSDFSGTVPTSD